MALSLFHYRQLMVGGWLLLAVTGSGADWPQWRGPNRDGSWNESGLIDTFPEGGPPVAWRVQVGPGWSSPVVAEGRVYLTDVQLARPVATERVLCFHATDGRLLWSHLYPVNYPDWAFAPSGGGPRATPIVRHGRVYTLGALGHLACLDAVRGTVLWEKDLAKAYGVKEFTGITASPLIEDERLILEICAKPAACVIALDTRTGKELWTALDDTFTYSSPIVLTAGGKRQLIVWTQEAVTSLDPATGRTWWREVLRTPGDQAVSTPVAFANRLLVGGMMFQLREDSPGARVLWPEKGPSSRRVLSNTSTALLQGGYVYSARTSGELVCLEAATGRLVWQTNTVTGLQNGSSIHLTPQGDAVFLFTDEGNLIRAQVSAAGYHEVSRAHLLDATYPFGDRKCAWTPPAFAGRHVLARNDRELVCVKLAAPGPGAP